MGAQLKHGIFAGGCFWCMVQPFSSLWGVEEVISGYTGGHVANPSYQEVIKGDTGHVEAVKVIYDPGKVSYRKLLETFWTQIDPTDPYGQFGDKGSHYRTAIFYGDQEQKILAEESKDELRKSEKFPQGISTEILPEEVFYPAEEYHQDFYLKNPGHYKGYRRASGRDSYIKKVWDSWERPSQKELKKRLTPLEYHVTQENGTEPPFRNRYYHNNIKGIYVDVVSGSPLFSSEDKFQSGSGWPSFKKPIDKKAVWEKEDLSHNMIRKEVRSTQGDSHLGHVFQDGPKPLEMRYCINSAALKFIPLDEMEEAGYGEYIYLFQR